MFSDQRSKKILIVTHCILNQNAKLDRCAHYPGAVGDMAHEIIESGCGVIQIACPEMICLGLSRLADPRRAATVEEEDTRIAGLMRDERCRQVCAGIASGLVEQIVEYRKHGFQVIGLIGINGSPTCGVETTWAEGSERPGPGVFIQELRDLLASEGIDLAMRGVKVYQPGPALESARELIRR